MESKTQLLITEVFNEEVKPAMGCTEAATVGIVSSLALNAALDNLDENLGTTRKIEAKDTASINSLVLTLDSYLFKNAADVGIPRTDGGRGIKLAATLGLFGDPKKRLQIFDSVSGDHLETAKRLEIPVHVGIKSEMPDIFAEVVVNVKGERWGRAKIQHEHDRVVLVVSNKKVFFRGDVNKRETTEKYKERFKNLSIDDLIDYAADLPNEITTIVKKGIEIMKKLSDEGLKRPLGMGVGYTLKKSGDDTRSLINARTASAIDARMFGSPYPAMAVAGSGNQGITATMPIYAYAEKNQMDEDLLVRSTALSYLVTIYTTYHSSYLSVICGLGSKAGIGSSAGLAYYVSRGDKRVVKRAIQNFIADIPGIICDGGKYSCALKGATASDAIYQSALLALDNREAPHTNGILGKNAEESIRNLGKIFKAIKPVNKTVVEIISKKLS